MTVATPRKFQIFYQKTKLLVALIAGTAITCFLMIASHLYAVSDNRYCFLYTHSGEGQSKNEIHTTRQQILLVSYGRSGSSFTSALISRHPDVFFVYEPLYVLNDAKHINRQKDSVAIIKAFMTCSFPDQYIYALGNSQHRNSDSTSSFFSCILTQTWGIPHLMCFLEFLNSCGAHKISFLKTIRFRVKWAETFLANNLKFKLLFLVRDPRATLFSQARTFRLFDWKTQIHNMSQEHCSMLEDDLMEAERLHRLFPGQVKGIRYEDGAKDTLFYTKDIYSFLQVDYNEDIAEYVANLTNAESDPEIRDYAYSLIRSNSSKAMDRWRFDAGYTNVFEVDKVCGHLYTKLGYKFVHSQAHLESSSSLTTIPVPGGIFY